MKLEAKHLLIGLLALTVVASGCLDSTEEDPETPEEAPEEPEEEDMNGEETTDEDTSPEENETEESETDTEEADEEQSDEVRQVEITGFADNSYDTDEVEVEAGETVEFVYNHEGGQHDLVLERDGERVDGTEVLSASGESDSFTYTFEEEDDYEFFCSVGAHRSQGMEGTVTVS